MVSRIQRMFHERPASKIIFLLKYIINFFYFQRTKRAEKCLCAQAECWPRFKMHAVASTYKSCCTYSCANTHIITCHSFAQRMSNNAPLTVRFRSAGRVMLMAMLKYYRMCGWGENKRWTTWGCDIWPFDGNAFIVGRCRKWRARLPIVIIEWLSSSIVHVYRSW